MCRGSSWATSCRASPASTNKALAHPGPYFHEHENRLAPPARPPKDGSAAQLILLGLVGDDLQAALTWRRWCGAASAPPPPPARKQSWLLARVFAFVPLAASPCRFVLMLMGRAGRLHRGGRGLALMIESEDLALQALDPRS